jgi:MscS family membrane protein
MNLQQQLSDSLGELIVRLLLIVLFITVLWVLRGILAWAVIRPLRRQAAKTPSQWDNVVLDILDAPVRYLVFSIGLYAILRLLFPAATSFADHLERTLLVLIVFVTLFDTVGIVALDQNRLFRLTGLVVQERLIPFVRTALRIVLVAFVIVIIIQEWGYDVSGLVAGLGLGGLAFSLAAQDLLANLFGFGAIVGDSPFIVGEFIKTADVEGTVEHVGLRSTHIRRPDQAFVVMPNAKLASSPTVNWSRLAKRYINATLIVSYTTPSAKVQELLQRLRKLLLSHEAVQPDSVVVYLTNFAPNGLEILVRCYLLLPDWTAFSQEREAINLEIIQSVKQLGIGLFGAAVMTVAPPVPLPAPEGPPTTE